MKHFLVSLLAVVAGATAVALPHATASREVAWGTCVWLPTNVEGHPLGIPEGLCVPPSE